MEYQYIQWKKILVWKFTKTPEISPNCSKHNIYEKDNDTLNNPILFKCFKCGKVIYLRNNNFLDCFLLHLSL